MKAAIGGNLSLQLGLNPMVKIPHSKQESGPLEDFRQLQCSNARQLSVCKVFGVQRAKLKACHLCRAVERLDLELDRMLDPAPSRI